MTDPSSARGEVRAKEVILGAYGGHPTAPGPHEAGVLIAALLALAPDAEGVAVMADGTVVGLEHAHTVKPAHPEFWDGDESALGDFYRLYRLTPPRREEQDR